MDPDLSVMNTKANPALRRRFDIAPSADFSQFLTASRWRSRKSAPGRLLSAMGICASSPRGRMSTVTAYCGYSIGWREAGVRLQGLYEGLVALAGHQRCRLPYREKLRSRWSAIGPGCRDDGRERACWRGLRFANLGRES